MIGIFGVSATGDIAGLNDITARLHVLKYGTQWEDCCRPGALPGRFDVKITFPDNSTLIVGAVFAVFIGIVAFTDRFGRADGFADQIAIGYAPNFHTQAGNIDGLDPNPVRVFARQDHAFARKTDIGGFFAKGEIYIHVCNQQLAVLSGQAPEQGHTAIAEAYTANA